MVTWFVAMIVIYINIIRARLLIDVSVTGTSTIIRFITSFYTTLLVVRHEDWFCRYFGYSLPCTSNFVLVPSQYITNYAVSNTAINAHDWVVHYITLRDVLDQVGKPDYRLCLLPNRLVVVSLKAIHYVHIKSMKII